MALPGLTGFRAAVNQIMSQGTPDVPVFSVKPHGLSSVMLAANAGTGAGGVDGPSNAPNAGAALTSMSAATVPASGSGLVCATSQAITRVYNPTDGKPVFIGPDNTIVAATAFLLNPGQYFGIETYLGNIWALSAVGLASTLYFLTEVTV